MSINNVNFKLLKKKLKTLLNRSDLRLNETYIDYLKRYNSDSSFKDISFIIKNENSLLFCPLTIHIKNKKKILDYFGEPFFIICHNETQELKKIFHKKIKKISVEEKIKNINFVSQKELNDEFNLYNLNKQKIYKISYRKYIDLTLDMRTIRANFSRGLKSKINKNYKELTYQLINHKNYNKDIFKMMKFHRDISKRITRSKATWSANEKMIKNKNGFLIKVTYKNKVISYFFIFYEKPNALYFSSCTNRKYFKDFNNITHKSIYDAIKYLKKIGCKKLTLGDCQTIYSSKSQTLKEKNIEKFKRSFGGDNFVNFFYGKFDKNF